MSVAFISMHAVKAVQFPIRTPTIEYYPESDSMFLINFTVMMMTVDL